MLGKKKAEGDAVLFKMRRERPLAGSGIMIIVQSPEKFSRGNEFAGQQGKSI